LSDFIKAWACAFAVFLLAYPTILGFIYLGISFSHLEWVTLDPALWPAIRGIGFTWAVTTAMVSGVLAAQVAGPTR
jgi:hypothetical protein